MVPPTTAAAAAAFSSYDRNGNGFISIDELKALLTDLGMLKGMSPPAAAAFVVSQFAMADSKTKDGKLDPQEFNRLYLKLAAPRLLEVLQADVPVQLAHLHQTFSSFAGFGSRSGGQAAPSGLDGARFIKLCRATGLVGRQLSSTEADLIFASFLDALDLIANKTGRPLPEVLSQVASGGGPATQGDTTGKPVKLHDGWPTSTAVDAHRTASTGSGASQQPASHQLRCEDRAAVGTASCPSGEGPQTSAAHVSTGGGSCTSGASRLGTPDVESRDSLRHVFLAFASFGTGASPMSKAGAGMDSKQFAKLCRETGMLDGRRLTSTAADLAFIAKAQPLGARKIGFSQFRAAVEQLAHEKGVPKEELFAQIASCNGPLITRSGVEKVTEQHKPRAQQASVHPTSTAGVTEQLGKISIGRQGAISITAFVQ
ncbi:Tubulin polymerization-promoting protein family member 2 [Chlorella vulgaris]